MSDSDGSLKPMPVAEFEGELVRDFGGKLPQINLEMAEGYPRGTHLKLEVEVRVRNVFHEEIRTGDYKGDLTRNHIFTLEEIKLTDAFDPAHRPTNVGGSSAGDAWEEHFLDFVHGDIDQLDFEGDEIPDRLREMLKVYFEHVQTGVDTEGVGF